MPRQPGAPRRGKSHQRKVRRELKYALAAANPVLWASQASKLFLEDACSIET